MTGVVSMAAAITPADKSLIVVIGLLHWMRRAKGAWLLQLANGPRVRGLSKTWLPNAAFSIKSRFRILNWLLRCSNRWAHLAMRVFNAAERLNGRVLRSEANAHAKASSPSLTTLHS
jgi:hypothetical protein